MVALAFLAGLGIYTVKLARRSGLNAELDYEPGGLRRPEAGMLEAPRS